MEIPAGFEPVQSGSPFVDLVGPFYFKELDHCVAIGLRVQAQHCNRSGSMHGGLIATMADIAMGNNIGYASVSAEEKRQWRESGRAPAHSIVRRVTVNLATDYMGVAKVGDWVEMQVDVQKLGQSMSFASARLHLGDEAIARSSGVFRNLG